MSDKEQGALSRSVSRSLSRDRSPASAKSASASPPHARSRSAHSRSRSRSRSRSYRKRSRSRSRSNHRRHYRSRSRSPRHRRRRSRHSRSRSRSGSRGRYGDGYSDRRRGFYRSHSRSPMSGRRRHACTRENPKTSKCVGVFGLSLYTQERDLRDIFGRYGPIEEIQVVYDHQTGRSRGFAFIYYRNLEDAVEAKERGPGTEIDGRHIRCDYSITERAHTPTPGIYLGKPTEYSGRGHYSRRSSSPAQRSRRYYSRSRSRSYSPRRY